MSQRDRRHRIRDIAGDGGYKEEGVFVQAGRGGHKGQPLGREETEVAYRQIVVY